MKIILLGYTFVCTKNMHWHTNALGNCRVASSLTVPHTHTHTHTSLSLYLCVCMPRDFKCIVRQHACKARTQQACVSYFDTRESTAEREGTSVKNKNMLGRVHGALCFRHLFKERTAVGVHLYTQSPPTEANVEKGCI